MNFMLYIKIKIIKHNINLYIKSNIIKTWQLKQKLL